MDHTDSQLCGFELVKHHKIQRRYTASTQKCPNRCRLPHTIYGRKCGSMGYIAVFTLLMIILAKPQVDAVDDCDSCVAGKYAPDEGSASCTSCGSGTYAAGTENNECSECPSGIFSEEYAYMGWCSVKRTMSEIEGNEPTTIVMYNGPSNTTWFHVMRNDISLRVILNSARTWTIGDTVRIESSLGQSRLLNPIILQRLSDGGVWSPVNVDPVHIRNSTRYIIL